MFYKRLLYKRSTAYWFALWILYGAHA